MKKLPFGVNEKPRVAETKAVAIDIEDHLGNSIIHVNTWWSGEGFTVQLEADNGRTDAIDFSWQEWSALKLAIKAIQNA